MRAETLDIYIPYRVMAANPRFAERVIHPLARDFPRFSRLADLRQILSSSYLFRIQKRLDNAMQQFESAAGFCQGIQGKYLSITVYKRS